MTMESFVESKCSFIIFETLSFNKVYKLLPVIIYYLASNKYLSYRLLLVRVIMFIYPCFTISHMCLVRQINVFKSNTSIRLCHIGHRNISIVSRKFLALFSLYDMLLFLSIIKKSQASACDKRVKELK